ncbi:MAG: hypothetical protein B6I19_05300, partial [Bacteroidetes bacterium 4572_114]
ITFTLSVTNNGPSDATGVSVVDQLPSGYTYVSDNGGGAYVPGTGIWTIGNLSIGTATMLAITATVNATGNYVNTATVSGNEDDNTPGNNTDDESTTPNPVADLVITKDDGATTFTPPTDVIYTITVTNNGPCDVTGAGVSDIAPDGTSIASWSAVVIGSAGVSNSSGNGDLVETVNIVAGPGNSVVFTLTLQVPSGFTDVLENTASVAAPVGVTDPITDNNSATDSNDYLFVNEIPIATDNEFAVDGNTAVHSANMITDDERHGTDSDPDSHPLTVTEIDGVQTTTGTITGVYGTLTWISDGSYTYTLDTDNTDYLELDEGENVVETFLYQITDGFGGFASANIIVNVMGQNDAPIANDDAGSTDEDTPLVVASPGILINDTDVDDEPLSVGEVNGETADVGNQITLPSGALLTVNADGSYTYDPNGQYDQLNQGESTTDSFIYTACDEILCDGATVIITIHGINLPPVAVNDNVDGSALAVITLNVTINDSDVDGNLEPGTVSFDPASVPSGVGTDTDLDGDIDQVVCSEGTWAVDETGEVTFTPSGGNYIDPTPIEYTISDAGGLISNVAVITLDYIPVASNDEILEVVVGQAATINVTLNDTDGDEVDATTVDLDASGIANASCTDTGLDGDCIEVTVTDEGIWSVDETTGEVTFTPDVNLAGDPTPMTYTVEDDEGNTSNAATVSITYICSSVQLKIFMEGPYQAGGSMTTTLNDNHLLPGQDKDLSSSFAVRLKATHTPFGHPYNVAPWNYTDNLGLGFGDDSHPDADPGGVIPYDPDVVDWILVTVREGGILPANNIWRCTGWLKSDGTVTFPEECACLSVKSGEDYYILVEHRNHLGVMSPTPVNKLNGTKILEWDFTVGNSYQPIFRIGQKEVETGKWAMISANGNQINSISAINSADHTSWKEDQNGVNYLFGDFNLNVISNSEDETIWKINQNKTSGVVFY